MRRVCVLVVGLVATSCTCMRSSVDAAGLSTVGEVRQAVAAQPPDMPVYGALGKLHRAAPIRVAWVYVQDLATAGYAVVHNDAGVPSYGALVLVENPTLARGVATVGGLLNSLVPYPDETPVFLALGQARIVAPFSAVVSGVIPEPDGYAVVCPDSGEQALLLVEAPRIVPPLLTSPRPARSPAGGGVDKQP